MKDDADLPKNSKNPNRDLTSHLEEEDLWDLEGEWADDDAPAPVVQDEFPLNDDTPDDEETAEEELVAEEESPQPASKDTEEEEPEETLTDTADDAIEAEETNVAEAETTASDEAAEEPTAKFSLKMAEKISLAVILALLLGGGIYAYVHVSKLLGKDAYGDLDLPAKGKHSEITEFETYWKSVGDTTGMTFGAQVVPSAVITISENSTGALRIYFRNKKEEIIGDPIQLAISGGKFPNGKTTITVSASDGFHHEADYRAYSVEREQQWTVQVLDAADVNADRSDFSEVLNTYVSPTRR